MVRCSTGGHKAILQATDLVIKLAATSSHGAPDDCAGVAVPSHGRIPKPHLDEGLYQHIRNRVVLWNADAAGDEQLAGQEARIWCPRADDVRPLLPNLMFVHRDKAHAGRRVLQRPWFADEVLKSVHISSVTIFSVIQHSPTVKDWYQQAQRAMPSQVKVQKDLSWCEIRFDSSARPLAVMVLTFDAVVATAIRNVTERRPGSDGREAGHCHPPLLIKTNLQIS